MENELEEIKNEIEETEQLTSEKKEHERMLKEDVPITLHNSEKKPKKIGEKRF